MLLLVYRHSSLLCEIGCTCSRGTIYACIILSHISLHTVVPLHNSRHGLGKRPDIQVHGANEIRFGNSLGNRERVEFIAGIIKNKDYANRFVGSVDREFREFELDDEIKDSFGKHNVVDRLVWTRGHSIENYYFDFSILYRSLRHFSVTSYFDDALVLFEQNLQRIMILACALGLASYECGMLHPVKSSMNLNVLEFDESGLVLNMTKWVKFLHKNKISNQAVSSLTEAFQRWLKKVMKTDLNVVRWLCHGHIGIAVIWAAYAKCILETSKAAGSQDPLNEAGHVLQASETVRCNGCASEWAQHVSDNACEYPKELFTLLNLAAKN